MAFIFGVLLLAASPPGSAAQETGAAIRLLAPGVFPRMPKAIGKHLRKRKCLIPQSTVSARPHNVISGAFLAVGKTDWAVLCSRHGASVILVFQAGVEQPVAELAPKPDLSFLQASAGGRVEYSRVLRVVAKADILSYHAFFGGERLPRGAHDGIEDAFAQKASIVHYHSAGRWRVLQGAD